MDVTTLHSLTNYSLSPTPILAEISLSQIFVALAAVAVLTLIMRSTGKRVQASRQTNDNSSRERYQELTQKSNMTRDVGEVMLELDKLARQVHGQMDTRFAKLEIAIRDADERIATLTSLLQRQDRSQHHAKIANEGPSTSTRSSIDITLESENPYSSIEPISPAHALPTVGDNRHQNIYSLADGGLPSEAIAQKVGQTTGEVELILALRKTRQQVLAAKNVST